MRSHPGGEEKTRRMLELAALPAGASVLDLGAGAGETLALLRALGYAARGIDLAPRAAVVNADDAAGARLLGELRGAVGDSAPRVLWSYGFTAGCDLRIRNLSLGPRGSAFDLALPGGRGEVALWLAPPGGRQRLRHIPARDIQEDDREVPAG